MAATRREEQEICWINDASDGEQQPVVFVPGLESRGVKFQTRSTSVRRSSGNNRHGADGQAEGPTKAHGGRKRLQMQSGSSGTKGQTQRHLNTAAADMEEHILASASSNCNLTSQGISDLSQAKSQASLKDLCPEDKRRIANLIQELARVSEEKDESVQRLRNEQETFERKIQNLEQQNLLIVEERESLQQQYRECQELLVLYQQYLSQQQNKLNQSMAQLAQQPPAHSKMSSSEEAPSRLDGSYLGLAAAQTGRSAHADASGSANHHHHHHPHHHHHASLSTETPPSSSSESQGSVTPRPRRGRRGGGGGGGGGGWSQQPSPPCHCGPTRHCCCAGGRADTPPRKGQSDRHHRCNPGPQCDRRLPPGGETVVPAVGDDGALTTALLGPQGWEEKRHQLLMTKMQLEVERERLQVRLAQQEARLITQNQQLRQERLDYNRFQQATQGEPGSSANRNAGSQPANRNAGSQPEDPSGCHVLSRQCEKVMLSNGDACPKPAQPPPAHVAVNSHEDSHRSKSDMATSPAVPTGNFERTTSVSAMPGTPEARLDSSLIELLEVFSPISLPTPRNKPAAQPPAVPRSACRAPPGGPRQSRRARLSPPATCYPQSPGQDLEESTMLDEIFFIC